MRGSQRVAPSCLDLYEPSIMPNTDHVKQAMTTSSSHDTGIFLPHQFHDLVFQSSALNIVCTHGLIIQSSKSV